MERLKAAIVGVGNISSIYLENLTSTFINRIELLGCADLITERARTAVKEFDLKRNYGTPSELYADPDIDIVINLTNPDSHYEVCLAALEAGKHTYVEKPLAIRLDDGKRLVGLAREKNLRIGGAPDTFLGGGIQTCRKLIDDGWIGEPVAATAFMINHGHESWHPDPEFYYKIGGGPMFDMGPYYLTALVNLIGPVKRITGSARITFPRRRITSEPNYGRTIEVDVPTHIAGVLDFHNGAIGTIITSFDVWAGNLPRIEIYGTEGSMSVPDPNIFGGDIQVRRKDHTGWHSIPWTHGYTENSRGLGAAEMADAISAGRPHRASGDLAYHVLECMHGIHIASETGTHYEVVSSCERPESLSSVF